MEDPKVDSTTADLKPEAAADLKSPAPSKPVRKQRRSRMVPVEGEEPSPTAPATQKQRMGFILALDQLSKDWPETKLTRMEGDMLSAWFSMKDGHTQEAIDRLRATANRLETRSDDVQDS